MFRTISSRLSACNRLIVANRIGCRAFTALRASATVGSANVRAPHYATDVILAPPQFGYCTGEAQPKKKQKKHPPAVDHVGRLDLRVGKILEVNVAPDAATLYLTRIDIGGEVLSIVAGLAEKIPAERLTGEFAVILCNLKPSKLRGHLSEGMIMCAKSDGQTELLQPPKGAEPGDLVHCEGYDRVPVEVPRDRKRLYDTLAEDMMTDASAQACYKGACLYIPDKGTVKVSSLVNAPIA